MKLEVISKQIPEIDDAVLLILELYPKDEDSNKLYSVTYVDAHRTPEAHILSTEELFEKYKVTAQ